LLASERVKFRTVADFTYDWETWIDQDGHYVYCSPSCIRITGRSADEFMADPNLLLNITHPDDRVRMETHLQLHSASDAYCMFEVRIVLPDGQARWLEHACQSVFSETGKFLGRRASNRDITERKQAEEALREQKKFLNTILESEPECVKVMSMDGKLLQMNQAGLAMLEVDSFEEAQNKGLISYILPEYHEAFLALGERVSQGESGVLSFQIKGAQGTQRWLESHASPLRDAKGGVVALVAVTRDITEHKKAEEEIRQLAFYDTLTALPNRRLLLDRLGKALLKAKRFERSLAIMFLDLDNFKKINDTLGHDTGDELLREVAIRLAACIRADDTVSRQGGDEFVILLDEIAQSEDAAQVADKIIKTIGEPIHIGDMVLNVTTSIGIAIYPVNGDDDARELMKKADEAMYTAKAAGRNGYKFFTMTASTS
jgi:diguanylate cyclase (GGDEF)-like protein/PAS domain S-box-containing protein